MSNRPSNGETWLWCLQDWKVRSRPTSQELTSWRKAPGWPSWRRLRSRPPQRPRPQRWGHHREGELTRSTFSSRPPTKLVIPWVWSRLSIRLPTKKRQRKSNRSSDQNKKLRKLQKRVFSKQAQLQLLNHILVHHHWVVQRRDQPQRPQDLQPNRFWSKILKNPHYNQHLPRLPSPSSSNRAILKLHLKRF